MPSPDLDNTPTPDGEVGQPIRTYTIAFNPPPDSAALMTAIALRGEGLDYQATSYEQLDTAFNDIISNIVPRSSVAFSPGTLQTEGLFSGNYIYLPTFQPVDRGHWFGTVKKHCVMPADETDETCLFKFNDDVLVTNTDLVDLWTNTSEADATVGGTGEQMFDLFGVSGPDSAPPGSPYSHRNIVTWRPGTEGYVNVTGTDLSVADTRTGNLCDHYALINKLHGYTHEVANCEGGDYTPAGFDEWPQADSANGGTVILKYSDECESNTSSCFVVSNANDGMLHVFRARDGLELSAVIPGELWGDSGINNNLLRDIMDQPNLDQSKRYYFDGGVRLYHRDLNTNGYIDGEEDAYLIAGLGRGGRAYYLWDVSDFNGDFSGTNPPGPIPLMADQTTGLEHLRDTWSPPWVGLFRQDDGTFTPVAAFGSGHQRELDNINAGFANLEVVEPPAPTDTEASPYTLGCTEFGIDSVLCTPPFPATGCTPCPGADPAAYGCDAVPETDYCYDWPGRIGRLEFEPFHEGELGHDLQFGDPFRWTGTNQEAAAYRVVFSRFELQPNDYMEFLDANQRPIGRLEGTGTSADGCPGAACSPWIYSEAFYVRLISDGNDDLGVAGWSVADIQIIRRNSAQTVRESGNDTVPPLGADLIRPSIYVVSLDAWRALDPFEGRPDSGDTRQAGVVLVRVTSDCEGTRGPNEICIDAGGTGGAAAQPDLVDMVCPITAEPSVYTEGGVFQALYVGDECGQIWKVERNAEGIWSAQRLIRLNNDNGSGRVMRDQRSEDYRKIFTRVELVLSRCNGSRSVGVYFGTGNIQRSASQTVLGDSAVARIPADPDVPTSEPADWDVIGVVWDSVNLPRPDRGLSLQDLRNVTTEPLIASPTAEGSSNGFFIELDPHAKLLRDPVVFDGVATYKVYNPTVEATECLSAVGRDLVYQFDNCNAGAIVDSADDPGDDIGDSVEDRITWRGDTDIGGGLMVFTPGDDAFVSTADTGAETAARLPGRPNQRATQIYLWRMTVDL